MKISDRLRRWWNPGKWADEHPETSEISDGEGFAAVDPKMHLPHDSAAPVSGGLAEH